jgi:hypothetical protein
MDKRSVNFINNEKGDIDYDKKLYEELVNNVLNIYG